MKDIYVIDTETNTTHLLTGIEDRYDYASGRTAKCAILYSKDSGYTYQKWNKVKFSHAGSTLNRFAEQFWWFMIGAATASILIAYFGID